MTLDLDDIAGRYNIADDGSRPGDSKSLADTLAREDAAYQETIRKLGGEVFKTDSTVSDTGQYNRLTNSTQTPTTTAPQQDKENPWDGYYVYDRESQYTEAPFAKNLFGANLDVALNEALGKIEFRYLGDGSLRNSIAYIRPWSRGGKTSFMQVGQSVDGSARNDALGGLLSNLWSNPSALFDPANAIDFATGLLEENLDIPTYVPKWNPEESLWDPANVIDVGIDLSFNDKKGDLSSYYYNTYSQAGNITPSDAQVNQDNLKPTTPINWTQAALKVANIANESFLGGTQAGNFVDVGLDLISNAFNIKPGPVFSGNLSGLNVIVDNYQSIFGLRGRAPAQISYQGKTAGFLPPPSMPEGVWQFMFNPSQLNLSVGPNFKEAETWGVSDEPNAGKPLHFTSYKNPELKFSKVLLNGYVFGRQVEALEQGLIELFMKTPPNESKHGPQVLEFVWGKKSFGPCVIKDVRITEKMWDQGLLVNAEVDFTLVKVPEWTINDGQVSTFDPSAQNTIVPPTKSPGSGIGSNPPSNSDTPQPDPDLPKCGMIRSAIGAGGQLRNKSSDASSEISKVQIVLGFDSQDQLQAKKKRFIDLARPVLTSYGNWVSKAVSADSTVRYSSKCSRESLGGKLSEIEYRQIDTGGAFSNTAEKEMEKARSDTKNFLTNDINNCVAEISRNLQQKFDSQCKQFGSAGNAGGAQSIDPNAPAYIPPGT